MRRREFLGLAASIAAALPLASHAQVKGNLRRVGVLMHTAAGEPEAQARLAAFLQGLQEAGWSVGTNIQVDVRLEHGRSHTSAQRCGAIG